MEQFKSWMETCAFLFFAVGGLYVAMTKDYGGGQFWMLGSIAASLISWKWTCAGKP